VLALRDHGIDPSDRAAVEARITDGLDEDRLEIQSACFRVFVDRVVRSAAVWRKRR
jgi:hypothetical protein